ncbi:hypothetical protein MPTK1_3g10540 [Marchantia polymorpha subsp. ruderalis]|uniref:Uncharacterized protein n=3 Tax=Marchantia polymorpha TaxID=3197 RepID=A0A176WRP4_MARPO|nr:hypothetical protein AXG93_927s1000 [Marchantia polymorpha subsp. ruderalis]OAE35213.1 hypothetical protein AXG93_1550s1190 [Marchantia polymorpha subsp. ruderalis]PTQ40977.1 hypothetical protein MARPO_0037s0142 [Marchantia polymorpha]BBN05127.1 hypothetical protein Mp_3g10540 [Marchantia polymorpha subsp. ruderalis]|eukprot:PTQ40977.1 hypothetical protein MARPO_0037s0142 [Marchantia polymorpha]
MEKLLPNSSSKHGNIDWTRETPAIPDLNSEKRKSSKELQFKEMIKGLADRIAQAMSESPDMGAYMLKQKRMCRKGKTKDMNLTLGKKLIAQRAAEDLKPDLYANVEFENLDDMGAYMLQQKQKCKQGRIADSSDFARSSD